ncbi:MAG: hypothetical protein ACRCST_08485 [Turicibacter sp.]
MANTYQSLPQSIQNTVASVQSQDQGLYIKNSHSISISQTEVEGLVVIQLSLQAAIDALLIAVDARDDLDITRLQKISNTLSTLQQERQKLVIENSNNITVNQIEIQIDIVVQAAIQLLAKITAKLIEI